MAQLASKELERQVSMQENGKPVQVTLKEAAVRLLVIKAVKGDNRAVRTLMALLGPEEARIQEYREDVFLAVVAYVKEWRSTGFNPAERNPTVPDPRDIEVDFEKREYTCRTALDPEFREVCDHIATIRDALTDDHRALLSEIEVMKPQQEREERSLLRQIARYDRILPARYRPDANPDYQRPGLSLEDAVAFLHRKSARSRLAGRS
jgi:hypothetical protein